jgi:hypothetical protein
VIETEAYVTAADMAMTANVNSYTLPSAVSRIKGMFVTPVGSVATQPLRQATLDQILAWRQAGGGNAVANGYVTHYAILGGTDIEVYPTPQAADVLTIYYVSLPTALSANADTPTYLPEPYASKVLEYGTLAEAADFKGDPSEQEYRALHADWMHRLRSHLTRKMGGLPGQFSLYPSRQLRPHDPSTDIGC